jgi:hypothetical protein
VNKKSLSKRKLPKILIYDIETTPLKAWIWRCGEQTVRHNQLDYYYKEYGISTIAYKWMHEKTVNVLSSDDKISKFDEEVKKADIVIGKNSDNFDVKHINTQRLLQNLPPMPQWLDSNDDLEKQMRRFFVFPSMSLDYISQVFGLGGKVKMEFQDWIDIENMKLLEKLFITNETLTYSERKNISLTLFGKTHLEIFKLGDKALDKMIFYNKKDVRDTEKALLKVLPHIKLKYNASTLNEGQGCITCGSLDLKPTKVIVKGKTQYQQFECLNHGGYGGKATWHYKKGKHNRTYGKMG